MSRALNLFEKYLVIAREIGDRAGEGTALGGMGAAYAALGQSQPSIEHLEQALSIAQDVGNVMGAAMTSFNLAVMLVEQDQPAEALPHAEYATQVFTELGRAPMLERVKALLAKIQTEQSD